ncbi:hypothetical protein DFQ26_005038 [Actinomortierella ambigua]|nr:hypothetical protein DFQ26_005038 [Actinomortierella ambigua]
MRLKLALLMFVAMLAIVQRVSAWEEGDFEIFDLVDALETAEGKDISFYSWLGVEKSTPMPEIEKAFRKKSRTLHPDKNPSRDAQEKYARLKNIITILRDDHRRDRYNFFLKNGVPRWRGTAYLYRRHRPGLKSVLVFLLVLVSGFQYLARYVSYTQERKRMQTLIEQYKEMQRERQQKILEGATTGRQRRAGVQTSETDTPSGEEERMVAVNQYGEEIELSMDNVHSPKVKDLVMFRLPFWIVKLALLPCPKVIKNKVYALSIFESIRPDDSDSQEADADAKSAVRKAFLAKKRAAKRAAAQRGSPNISDEEDDSSAPYGSDDDEPDEEELARRAKEEELAAARRRRRMKAPGQASKKGGRRG